MNQVEREDGPVAKGHILVVDDDATFGEVLCRVLRSDGYQARLAGEFRSALEILESDQPVDLLLVDIVMPDSVNGVALSRMARLRRRNLKVVYITGYSIPGAEREALGPILRKPVDNQVLLDEIARTLAS
ncbi:MAG: response regulator [Acetobacteraceae bacterium]